jgi:hypothetical protein
MVRFGGTLSVLLPNDRYMIRILPSKVIAISAGKSISIGNDYAAIPGQYSVVVVFTKQWEIFKARCKLMDPADCNY